MNRRQLFASTALASVAAATPALAADPIKIDVGGYYQFYAVAGAMESNYALNGASVQYKGIEFLQQGEIYFMGQSKLDNGTTFGIRVQLEGWNPQSTAPATTPAASGAAGTFTGSGVDVRQVDEAYFYSFGDWGRVEFGSKDGAGYMMYYGAPSAVPGWGFFKVNSNFTWSNPVAQGFNVAANRILGSTLDVEQNKPNRINYFTPRLYGFQVGVSYAPAVQPKTQPGSLWGLAPGPGTGTGGVCGFSNATTADGCPTNNNSWQDAVALGLNYLNKFGEVAVAVYGGYSFSTFVPSLNPVAGAFNTINGANLYNWNEAVIGLQLSMYGFTVGGSWGWDNNGLGRNAYTNVDNDTRTWAAGIMYETGPWQMSAGFTVANNDNGNGTPQLNTCAGMGTTSSCNVPAAATPTIYFGNNPNAGAASFGTVSASRIEVGGSYQLGPGIKAVLASEITNLSGPSSAVAGQAWGVMLGMDLHF